MSDFLQVNNVKTSFFTQFGEVQAVGGVSFGLNSGEVLGIVGESGSGKSVTMLSIMRLLDDNGKVKEGEVLFEGKDLVTMSEADNQRRCHSNDFSRSDDVLESFDDCRKAAHGAS